MTYQVTYHELRELFPWCSIIKRGTQWSVAWGTAPQVGRSWVWFPMVSQEFFIDVILPAALWPLGLTHPLTEMNTRNISWDMTAAGAYGRQLYHFHVPSDLKSRSLNLLEPPRSVQACNGNALPSITKRILTVMEHRVSEARSLTIRNLNNSASIILVEDIQLRLMYNHTIKLNMYPVWYREL